MLHRDRVGVIAADPGNLDQRAPVKTSAVPQQFAQH
jgi:hypothetical protein